MKRVVVTGVGFTLPYGVGNKKEELDFTQNLTPREISLSSGEKLFHFDIESIETHRYYPSRKELRHMRPDAVYALIAAQLAMDDAGLTTFDHLETSYYTGTGQCYGDMSPFIKAGLEASQVNGEFSLEKFGKEGRNRVNPFFSIRTLGALPMATVAQKFNIHGENYVHESFGAESVAAFSDAVRDIKMGKTKLAIVAAQDYLQNVNEMDNIYYNSFYEGDFTGSSSAVMLILEEIEHNQSRGGKCYGEILDAVQNHYPISKGNKINFPEMPFKSIKEKISSTVDEVHLTGTGTNNIAESNSSAVKELFPSAKVLDYSQKLGDLLATAEPFGALSHLLFGSGIGLSLSRSVCGLEAGVLIDKECSNA